MHDQPPRQAKLKTDEEIESAVEECCDGMYRLALSYCDCAQAQDIVQEAFLRYMRSDQAFHDGDHRKAWLYRVVINLCKDYHRSWWQKMRTDYPRNDPAPANEENNEILDLVRSLPSKEASVLYLHYYESLSADQIAQILNCRPGTVYSLLSRGRGHLKVILSREHGKEDLHDRRR